ncbi:MAG: hypothetical protein IJ019_03060 [Alphaproteobacteria bacterium]|nr:hypothetical protein [Alphaproteobacteria bacterium]
MPYETYMGTFKNENDHNLERKFGYKYRALKGIYPDAYKLPETEVSKAIDVFYDGDANEDVTTMTDRVRNYTTAKEPEWKAKYFGEAPKTHETKKGFGDYMSENVADMVYGVDKALSGGTLGVYDWLKEKTGIGVNETDYLDMKQYNDGTTIPAQIGGAIAQYGAEALTSGYGLYKGLQMADKAVDGYTRYRGRNELKNQLRQGNNFQDINFGKVHPSTMRNVNCLRENGNLPLLNKNAYIPANVVKKLYHKRLNEGYTPEQLVEMAKRLFHEGPNMVSESKYPHIQQVVYPRKPSSDHGYISQNPVNGQTVIKSMYKK